MHAFRKHIALILIATALVATASAQSVRLTPYRAPSALYLDASRFYDYNIYEHNRFELGVVFVTPNEGADPKPRVLLGQWTASAYFAYGTMDRDPKFGGKVVLRLPGNGDVRLSLRAFRDLEAAASRTLEPFRMTAVDCNSHYVWSRFSGVRGIEAACDATPLRHLDVRLCFRHSREDYRFDSHGLFYPTLDPAEQQPVRTFNELKVRLDWNSRATLLVRAGSAADSLRYISAIAQYQGPVLVDGLTLFAQLGYATRRTPYSRLFDLSGTAGTPYFFRYSFLSLPTHCLVAHAYALCFANYTHPKPLWNLSWSKPRPFVQLGAMYGHNWGDAPDFDAPLTAPEQGFAEFSTGFDRLLRWGVLDLGAAVSFQILPSSDAPYAPAASQRLSFAAVATLAL